MLNYPLTLNKEPLLLTSLVMALLIEKNLGI